MKQTLIGVLVLAWGTWLEAIRSRLLILGALFALALVGISVAAASVSFGEQARLILDVGLAAASGLGNIIALSLAVAMVSGDLRRKTAYPILARPIPRTALIVGKYLGISLATAVVASVMVVATLLTAVAFGSPVPTAAWSAWALTLMEMQLVTAVGVLFSSASSPVIAAAFGGGLVVAGNLAGDLLRLSERMMEHGDASGMWVRLLYYLLPDLERLSLRTQVANDLPVPAHYVALGSSYALCYAAATLTLAAWIFSRRRGL